jgi:hypothetical protein
MQLKKSKARQIAVLKGMPRKVVADVLVMMVNL